MPHDVKFLLVGRRRPDGTVRPFKEPRILRHMRPKPGDEYLYVHSDGRPVCRQDVLDVCGCKECRAALVHRNAELRALDATSRTVKRLN